MQNCELLSICHVIRGLGAESNGLCVHRLCKPDSRAVRTMVLNKERKEGRGHS